MPYGMRQLHLVGPFQAQTLVWASTISIDTLKGKTMVMLAGYVALLIFFTLLLCPLNLNGQELGVPINRKVINSNGYKEVLYITKKSANPRTGRVYHWYKTRQVHTSQSNYAGELLDGEYIKYYPGNQLAEKGWFKKGLRVSVRNTWHPNGKLHTRSKWKKGKLYGKYIKLDSLGNILEMGRYGNGLKKGEWIFPTKGDTILYKRGEAVNDTIRQDSLKKTTSFFKRIFQKNEEKAKKSTKTKNTEKKGFFKRFFGKKEDTEKVTGNKGKDHDKEPNGSQKTEKRGFLKNIFKKKERKDGDGKT